MYNTSNNYKEVIYSDSTRHLLRVFADDTEIESKYISSFKPFCKCLPNDEFCLGSVCARTVKLIVHKNAISGEFNQIRITTGITGEEIPFGIFRVIDKKKVNDNSVELSLEDDMTKFEDNYDGSDLPYPITLKVVLEDICNKKGVELRFYFFFAYEQKN